jgi:hypothetical protein
MDSLIGAAPAGAPVRAYSRAAIDEFLSAAAEERAKLEAAVSHAEERTRRARASLGTHRVMVAMLLEGQRELDEIRARAEAEATAVLADAPTPPAGPLSHGPAPAVLDLTAEPSLVAAPQWSQWSGHAMPVAPDPGGTDGDDYFRFLRGALADEQPLGPRPESA